MATEASLLEPSSPDEMAQDSRWYVRLYAATNPRLPRKSLSALSTDEKESIRLAVAANPHSSLATLASLLQDTSKDVQAAALRTLTERHHQLDTTSVPSQIDPVPHPMSSPPPPQEAHKEVELVPPTSTHNNPARPQPLKLKLLHDDYDESIY